MWEERHVNFFFFKTSHIQTSAKPNQSVVLSGEARGDGEWCPVDVTSWTSHLVLSLMPTTVDMPCQNGGWWCF